MSLGWTSSEKLVVVAEDGTMTVFSIHGQLIYTRVITRVRRGCGLGWSQRRAAQCHHLGEEGEREKERERERKRLS